MSYINQADYRKINIQFAQSNFYHYCHLMFPGFYPYHGFAGVQDGKKILTYPTIDYELPGLNEQERALLVQYKNYDNITDAMNKGLLTIDKTIESLVAKELHFKIIRKKYLFDFCNSLQAFYENRMVNKKGKPYQKLMINMPPRSKKTLTLKLFTCWMLGNDNTQRIFAVSYNKDLSVRFGKDIRNSIEAEVMGEGAITLQDIFPGTRIKRGDGAKESWSLEGQHFTFLSTSPTSTQTGIGFNIALIDDIVKNALHYYNENNTAADWEYMVNTLLSRKENSKARIVVVMHRWGEDDLCGKLLAKEGSQWAVIKFPAYNEKHDVMLDPEIMTKEDFLERRSLTNPDIFEANYMQHVIRLSGYLYAPFKTYAQKDLPEKFEYIGFYADTADQGDDYLAAGFFGYYQGIAYILDIVYTQLSAEDTELMLCDTIIRLGATTGMIESNSGGHAYARNIRRILEEKKQVYNESKKGEDVEFCVCFVSEFTQSENKRARILTGRTNVTSCIIMPENWSARWPEFYTHMTTAKIKAIWVHDDAMDMMTGIYEKYIDYIPTTF